MLMRLGVFLLAVSPCFSVDLRAQDVDPRPSAESREVARRSVDAVHARIRAMSFAGESGAEAIERTADAINATAESRRAFGEVMRRYVAVYGPLRSLKADASAAPPPNWLSSELEALVFGPAEDVDAKVAKITALGVSAQRTVAAAYTAMSRPYGLALTRGLAAAQPLGTSVKGQFAPIGDFGPTVLPVLANMVVSGRAAQRESAMRAIRDIVKTPEKDMVDVIKSVADARQAPIGLLIVAACTLAEWGDPSYVDSLMKSASAKCEDPEGSMRFSGWSTRALVNQELGRHADAAKAYDAAIADIASGKPPGGLAQFLYNAACAHAAVRSDARALELLDLAVKEGRKQPRPLPRALFLEDPDLARLRGTPEWRRWMAAAFPGVESAPTP